MEVCKETQDKECYLMDPLYFRFYKAKESQIIKAQKDLNDRLLDSVMSYGEIMDIITKEWTDEEKELYEETKDLEWHDNNLGIGRCELIRENTTTKDGKTIIRFVISDYNDDEEEEES